MSSFYDGTVITQLDGVEFDLANPDPDAVSFPYIATCLGNLARYVGGTIYHYSVAQHCVLLSRTIARMGLDIGQSTEEIHANQMACLLHDAHEAYTGDLSVPMRNAMNRQSNEASKTFDGISMAIQDAIEDAAGFYPLLEADVEWIHSLDRRICVDEVNELKQQDYPMTETNPVGALIEEWHPITASTRWLTAFESLHEMLNA